MKPSEIITYIKDQKEKGYEAETILKGLEAKLEIEQDTSDWEKDLDNSIQNKWDIWGMSFNEDDYKDFIRSEKRKSFEEVKREIRECEVWSFKYPDAFGMEGRTHNFIDKDDLLNKLK